VNDFKIDNRGVVCYPFQAMLDAQELAVALIRDRLRWQYSDLQFLAEQSQDCGGVVR
jgi:hypothetical protein